MKQLPSVFRKFVAACRMALPAKMTEEIPAVGDVPSMLFVL
jgi:hypothetical protein